MYLMWRPGPVAAADSGYTVTGISQEVDARTGERKTEIRCACYSSTDRITVVDHSGDNKVGSTIDEATDMTDDLWLFDVGNRGYYQLAVQFGRDGSRLTADVYEDQNGDGRVDISEQNGYTKVAEPGYPALHVVALDGFWQRDGRLAPDFDITVDDRMLATFGGELYEQRMKNDGQADVVIHVRGPHDGDPRSYDWRNVYTPVPASEGILRTTLMVRERGQEPAFAPVFPWYLLGATYGAIEDYAGGTQPTVPLTGSGNRPYGLVMPYGQSFAPIQVDWSAGRIAYVGEFIASRASDENWFTYSTNRIEPGSVTDPNFESPFAFYNISGDQSGIPSLEVRAERTSPGNPFVSPAWVGRTYQMIRYSWKQYDDQQWTFKLGLLGQQTITSLVRFPDFVLKTVPYQQFPQWVADNTWDIGTFVANESSEQRSNEGIYAWDPGGAVRDQFYAGAGSAPAQPFGLPDIGLRAEYTLHLEDQPWLYFSPVDARLHLVGATSGIYNIDDNRQLSYGNAAGGSFIDSWVLSDRTGTLEQLYQTATGLLFAGGGRVSVLTGSVPRETFRTLPPTNHDEWQKLGDELASNKRGFAADDLKAMFDQFSGTKLTITGASVDSMRFTPDGYRFILTLRDGYDLGAFPIRGITGPGQYAVQYDNASGTFSAQPATPGDPTMQNIQVSQQPRALQPATVSVAVGNSGSEDLARVPVIVTAQRKGGEPVVVTQDVGDLLAGEQRQVQASWQPPGPGDWTISAKLYSWGGDVVERSTTVHVASPPRPRWERVILAGWPGTTSLAYLGLALGLIVVPACGGFLLARRSR